MSKVKLIKKISFRNWNGDENGITHLPKRKFKRVYVAKKQKQVTMDQDGKVEEKIEEKEKEEIVS